MYVGTNSPTILGQGDIELCLENDVRDTRAACFRIRSKYKITRLFTEVISIQTNRDPAHSADCLHSDS